MQQLYINGASGAVVCLNCEMLPFADIEINSHLLVINITNDIMVLRNFMILDSEPL